jgi:hypothetical protein
VDVDAVLEGAPKFGNVGDMGQDAKFDLAVVERNEKAAFGGDESLADPCLLYTSDAADDM